MDEFLIPLPLAMRDIASKILVLPQPFLPKKIFSLSSKKRFKLLKFLKVVKLIFFIIAKFYTLIGIKT